VNNPSGATAQQNQPENFLLYDRLNLPVKDPEWIFEDLWAAGTIGLFTGDGGIGKSHWSLQLIVAIASGQSIDGTCFTSSKPRDVVFISQEDDGEFVRAELSCQFPNLVNQPDVGKRIRIISTAIQGPNLFLSDKKNCLDIANNLPDGSVFVLDSFSNFLTSNEIDNTALLQNEFANLRSMMKARRASPLLIHHRPKQNAQTGQQSASRGATAIPQSCRFHIMLEKNRNGAGVSLSFEKVSRGGKPDSLTLIFDPQRKLFVPEDLDPYVALFKIGEQFTLDAFIQRLGKDPNDKKEQKRALDIIAQRCSNKGGWFDKVVVGKRGQPSIWQRQK
jgi:RecA-family ATPase